MPNYAICPFYEFEKRLTLHCEDHTVRFPSEADRGMWMKMHCASWNFKICKFYTELMKKYNSDN